MSAYVIVDIEVENQELYDEYKQMTPATIAAFGGRFLVRGGRAQRLEGDREPNRVVILEFDSFERAREWWASEEYREPKALRQRAARTRMIVVEGV